jgi:multicomponent Na+:H+ antiporter subunit D
MKGCLFQVSGAIQYRTGFWQISKLAGLGKRMPWTMGAFTIAAISMIGIPPAAGFFSKWYLVLGSIEANNWIFAAVILVSSLLGAVYFFRVLDKVYTAPPENDGIVVAAKDPPLGMLLPMVTLAIGTILLGLINVLIVTNILNPVVT